MYLSRRNVYIFINFSLNSDLLRHSYPILKATFIKCFLFEKERKEKRFAIIKNSSYKTWIFNKISYQILKFVSLKALIYIVILARCIHDRSRALG